MNSEGPMVLPTPAETDWQCASWHEWYDCYETEGLDRQDEEVEVFAHLEGKHGDRTNFIVPRRLPRGRVQRVEQVRAVCSEPLVAPVRHHLRHADVRFQINDKAVLECPLLDVVLSPRRLSPVTISSEHDIGVRVRFRRPTPGLSAYLRQQYGALEGLEALAAEAGPRFAGRFKASAMQVWLFFGGPMTDCAF